MRRHTDDDKGLCSVATGGCLISRAANRSKAQPVSRRCKLIRAKQRRECQDVSDLERVLEMVLVVLLDRGVETRYEGGNFTASNVRMEGNQKGE